MAGYGACGGSGLSAPAVNHTDRVLKQLLDKRLAAIPICFVLYSVKCFQSPYGLGRPLLHLKDESEKMCSHASYIAQTKREC